MQGTGCRVYDKLHAILFYTLFDRRLDEKMLTFSIIFLTGLAGLTGSFLSATKFCQRQKILSILLILSKNIYLSKETFQII